MSFLCYNIGEEGDSMKKIISVILILITLGIFPFLTVRADFGPKSSVIIDIIGVDQPYFFELLYEDELPMESKRTEAYLYATEYQVEHPFFPEMIKDFTEDGYISSFLYRGRPTIPNIIGDNTFRYTYVPPQTFKLIIVFENGTYVTSPIITTKLFSSHVTWDLSHIDISYTQSNVGTLEEVIPLKQMSFDLLLRILVTIGVELLILLAFKYHLKKSYLLVLLVNLVTQTLLTTFMFSMRYFFMPFFGEIIGLTFGELIVFIVEVVIFMRFLREKSSKRAFGYALLANLASLIIGFILMVIFWV